LVEVICCPLEGDASRSRESVPRRFELAEEDEGVLGRRASVAAVMSPPMWYSLNLRLPMFDENILGAFDIISTYLLRGWRGRHGFQFWAPVSNYWRTLRIHAWSGTLVIGSAAGTTWPRAVVPDVFRSMSWGTRPHDGAVLRSVWSFTVACSPLRRFHVQI